MWRREEVGKPLNVTVLADMQRFYGLVVGLLPHSHELWSPNFCCLKSSGGCRAVFQKEEEKEGLLPHEATKCCS